MAPPAVTLADYRTQVRDLLRDKADDLRGSSTQKDRWINSGIRMRDIVTQANRSLLSWTATAASDSYTIAAIGNARVFDIVSVSVIYGNLRIVLEEMSFTKMNARLRAYSPVYQNCPVGYARYGPTTIYLAPAPSQAFTLEADCCVYSGDLTADDDADALPYPYTDPVPYYACFKAKLYERRLDEALRYFNEFQARCASAQGARTGQLMSAY